MKKLTKNDREFLAKRIVARTIEWKQNELNRKRYDLALAIRDSILGESLKAFNSLPDWITAKSDELYFRHNISDCDKNMSNIGTGHIFTNEHIRIWSTKRFAAVPVLTDKKLIVQFLKSEQEKDDLEKLANEIRHKALSILNSVATGKRLLQVWPEVRQFLTENELAEIEGIKQLPAVRTDEINKLLGIGTDDAEK